MSKPPLAAAAFTSSTLPTRIGVQEAVLLQAGSGLEDAGVGALGVDDLARIGFENFNQIFKHGVFLQYVHLFSVFL